jgi:hypothetical protein
MSGARLLLLLYAFMAWTGKTVPYGGNEKDWRIRKFSGKILVTVSFVCPYFKCGLQKFFFTVGENEEQTTKLDLP